MIDPNIKKFVGTGLIFPLQLDSKGVPKVASGFELIRSDLSILLSWPSFSRFFLSEYGSRVEELIEEPNGTVLKQVVRRFIIDAITEWEKRITLTSVSIKIDPLVGKSITISLSYKLTNTNIQDSFIFPFYQKIVN